MMRHNSEGLERARLMLQLWNARVNLLVIGEKIARQRAISSEKWAPYNMYMLYAAHEQACDDVWKAQHDLLSFDSKLVFSNHLRRSIA